MPNTLSIIHNGTVCAEYTCTADIHKAHAGKSLFIKICLRCLFLNFLVISKVSQRHIRVNIYKRRSNLVELLAVDAVLNHIDSAFKHLVVIYIIHRMITVAFKGFNFRCFHAEDEYIVLADSVVNLNICAVHSTESYSTVEHKFHVARSGSLRAGK